MTTTPSLVDRWLWRVGVLDRKSPLRVNLYATTVILAFHLLALLAVLPWLFSWTGLAWAVVGLNLFGTLGINVCYHRLLTHRGFTCPPWLEHSLAILGVCCQQGTPIPWVAVHRKHHQHSDEEEDPHSPRKTLFWGHVGWVLVKDPSLWTVLTYDRYARDLISDRFYKWLERPGVERKIQVTQWLAFLLGGAIVGGVLTWSWWGALQLGLSWITWGVIVRTVAVWHITWSVNSVTHWWGYRNFPTKDDSRNNWLVALLSNGEGWHNNHHAEPRCASHGRRWWEFDGSYLFIRLFVLLGLAKDVVTPKVSRLLEEQETRAAA